MDFNNTFNNYCMCNIIFNLELFFWEKRKKRNKRIS